MVQATFYLYPWSSDHYSQLPRNKLTQLPNFLMPGTDMPGTDKIYYLWFGTSADPQGEMPLCGGLIFSDGFESGDTTAWSNTVP